MQRQSMLEPSSAYPLSPIRISSASKACAGRDEMKK